MRVSRHFRAVMHASALAWLTTPKACHGEEAHVTNMPSRSINTPVAPHHFESHPRGSGSGAEASQYLLRLGCLVESLDGIARADFVGAEPTCIHFQRITRRPGRLV